MDSILRHSLSLVWNLFMENRDRKNFLVGIILFLMGAGAIWLFTWMIGVEHLRPVVGVTYLLTYLLSIFFLILVPWAFPSTRGMTEKGWMRKLLLLIGIAALVGDAMFWTAAALGVI